MILGFIVSKEGKLLDPKKIEAITNMPIPRNPQQIQYSMGWHWSIDVLSKTLLLLWAM